MARAKISDTSKNGCDRLLKNRKNKIGIGMIEAAIKFDICDERFFFHSVLNSFFKFSFKR
jgi:hypothetical protein